MRYAMVDSAPTDTDHSTPNNSFLLILYSTYDRYITRTRTANYRGEEKRGLKILHYHSEF
jgi:hypothetical protein